MKDSLCWKCSNTCGGCSWTKSFVPVKGWAARKVCIKNASNITESYFVIECPKFTPFSPCLMQSKLEWYCLYKKHSQWLTEFEREVFKAYIELKVKEASIKVNLNIRTFGRREAQIKKSLRTMERLIVLEAMTCN